MKKLAVAFTALALLLPMPALGVKPYPYQANEEELIKYEARLKEFFSIPPLGNTPRKYLETDRIQRGVDAQNTCAMLSIYKLNTYMSMRLQEHKASYSDNQRLEEAIAYTFGVTIAAIDSICTEHDAQLQEFLHEIKQSASQMTY